MKTHSLILSSLLGSLLLVASVQADTLSAKQQYAEDAKRISARYTEDKKLCSEESESAARMQCLRDAKTERDKAMKMAKDTLKTASAKPVVARPANCPECGKVMAINVKEKAGESGAVGIIAGGLTGALIGNQVGKGHGNEVATVAGAAGGALLGNHIEKKVKTSKFWEVVVQHNNGHTATYSFPLEPGFAVGDVVAPSGDSIVKR